MVLASHADSDFPLEHETSWNGLQKPEDIETSQPQDVLDRPHALYSWMGSSSGFVMETLHKGLRIVHFYDLLGANVLKMYALIKFEPPTLGILMLLSEFSASNGVVLRLQLSTVPKDRQRF